MRLHGTGASVPVEYSRLGAQAGDWSQGGQRPSEASHLCIRFSSCFLLKIRSKGSGPAVPRSQQEACVDCFAKARGATLPNGWQQGCPSLLGHLPAHPLP